MEHMRRHKKTLLGLWVLTILPLLTACNPFMYFRPDSDGLRERAWAARAPRDVGPAPLYCYRTIGEEVCRNAPNNYEHNRLVGYYGPDPIPAYPADPYETVFD